MGIRVSAEPLLAAPDAADVRTLAQLVEHRDGQPPLSDQALSRLLGDTVRHWLARDGERVVGYAQLDGESLEVLAERADELEALLRAAHAEAPPGMLVWAHGRGSPLAAVLESQGYRRHRVLHQLRRALDAGVELVPPAEGVSIRAFVPGQDEQEWLRVNKAAFATHPEQGGWTRDDLEAREGEPWFEPAGFLLAVRDATLLGFHWTKVHDAELGEVYVLGVDPAAQRLGLGAALLTHGLAHLAARGCRTVLLYVDESNQSAMRLYAANGFESYDIDVQYVI